MTPAPDDLPPLAAAYDLVIVGSGGGSMLAALEAKRLGKSVVILEKQAKVGGSTGYSGGVWWVPANPLLARSGIKDSIARGRDYLDSVVRHDGPAVTPARRDAFLNAAPAMLSFLETKGMKLRRPVTPWPDYYDDLPGGEPAGRSVMAVNFNIRELGSWSERLSTYAPLRQMPIGSDAFPTLFLMKRTFAGKVAAMKVGLALAARKLFPSRDMVANGAAIQGRMLQIALREDIAIYPDTPVDDLVIDGDRVVGVRASRDGVAVTVRARDGVLINAGGFSRNQAMRALHQQRGASDASWTNANPGDTGEMIATMMAMGAATDCLDAAWWVPTSRNVDGTWPAEQHGADGTVFPPMHHLDLSLPHLIMVDQDGRRVANESGSYMEIGERMYDRQQQTGRALPCWTIMDQTNRDRYHWGSMPSGTTPAAWIDSGYMKRADTLEALAALCGIEPVGLLDEVARFNGFCDAGVDLDFARGGRVYDRSHGDPTVKPNPSLGRIETGPFYAVAMYPGDVGTAGGVVTDEHARVLREDGSAIAGLYATGNSTASVFGRTYPGAGASISASFAFGYLAARHAAGCNEPLATPRG